MVGALGLLDWLLLAVAAFVTLGIGWAERGSAKSLDAYLVGGRNLPWWAILGSIVATETSTVTVLSNTTPTIYLKSSVVPVTGTATVAPVILKWYKDGVEMTS
ncbi:MAG: hypothetical protein ACOVNV_04980, partial [Pirellulaceae bacterium]